MGMQGGGRRITSGGTGTSGSAVHLGGFGYHAGGSATSSVAREMIEGPGIRIYDPAARYGNTTFAVMENDMVIGRAIIDGQLGVQQIGLLHGEMHAVEFSTVSFRLFSAQPTTMKGGIYTRPDTTNRIEAELIPDTQSYESWRGGIRSIKRRVEPFYRKTVGLWWVPSVISPIPLTFEVEISGVPRWTEIVAGAQEL